MPIKSTNNTVYIKAKISANIPLALRLALDDIHRVADPVTPKRLGDLRSQVRKQVLGQRGSITWLSRHAIYQENKQYANYTTPGTGPGFARKSAISIVGEFDKYLKKAGL